ncbi:hypothetical protein T12_506 [Trichinella patagoniensis]|uniref:Uncharacterized protein n=1 Tax=Trichinella patagoniensis TaxID=990121 RepID=A0A0V0YVS1_9BILA|nr:hypothetical protein T12_506 [Trichinella patagoniensis]
MDAYWTYVLSRLTFQLTISKFHRIKQSTAEYNRNLDADQALLFSPQMMLCFVRAIVARPVRNRKGYAVPYDAPRLDDLMHVFMIKIPNPVGSATQFQVGYLDISNPSRPGPDAPDPLYQTGN